MRLVCSHCGAEYDDAIAYKCSCKQGLLEATYDVGSMSVFGHVSGDQENTGMWRYRQLLPPLHNDCIVTLQEGCTPLLPSRMLGRRMDIELYLKDETRNPSGSFKDRAASVMVSKEKSFGTTDVVTASSGNAAISIARYSALADITAHILLTENTTREKRRQIHVSDPHVYIVSAEAQQVIGLAEKATEEFGWSPLTTVAASNPYVIEGYKTIAFELATQLSHNPPDVVLVPVGTGTLLIGIWKGFCELQRLGYLEHPLPRIIAVQARGAAPIVEAYEKGLEHIPRTTRAETIAGGIAVADPGLDGIRTLEILRTSGGAAVQVTDDELLKGIHELAACEGVLAEPSGVASYTGLKRALTSGYIAKGECAVCIISGSGLNDMNSIDNSCPGEPRAISPNISALRDAMY